MPACLLNVSFSIIIIVMKNTMLKSAKTILLIIFLSNTNYAMARPGIGESFQDWTEFCEVSESKQESCNIYQTLTLKGEKTPILSLRVQYITGKLEPLLFITLQLGVFLSYQPIVELDNQPLQMQFQFCEKDGCTAAMVLTDPMLKAIQNSTTIKVKFVNLERKLIAIPVSTKGFTKGLAKIKKQQKSR